MFDYQMILALRGISWADSIHKAKIITNTSDWL